MSHKVWLIYKNPHSSVSTSVYSTQVESTLRTEISNGHLVRDWTTKKTPKGSIFTYVSLGRMETNEQNVYEKADLTERFMDR